MKFMRTTVIGAVLAACAFFTGFSVKAANPASYLQADADIVGCINIKAAAESRILLANGIDLNALFQSAVLEDDDIPVSTLPTSCYFAVSDINEMINMAAMPEAGEIKPRGSFVITGSPEFVDELMAAMDEDDDTTKSIISGLEVYSAVIADELQGTENAVIAAKVDAETVLFTFNMSEDQFADAASGSTSNYFTKNDIAGDLIVIAGNISDPGLSLEGMARLYETESDIQLQFSADFNDEATAAAFEMQFQESLQTLPAILASFNAAASADAAGNISVERNGSVLTVTIPQVNIVVAELIPVIMMEMTSAQDDIDWDDDSAEWDEDFDFDDDDFDDIEFELE